MDNQWGTMPDVIIPVALEFDWPREEAVISGVLEQHRRFGFTRFMLAGPCGGWRAFGFPPLERYRELAEKFARVRDALAPHGIVCGWWLTATVKTGTDPAFTSMVKGDGSVSPVAPCPLDENFRRELARRMALFCAIARPAFVFTEDDFSVVAAAGGYGCFCPLHLAEFARREGRAYTREELVGLFSGGTEEGYALLRRWQRLTADSLVGLARRMRREIDLLTPEIPMGTMQQGGVDREGACTEAMARAMAGPNHRPYSRLCGGLYSCAHSRSIPRTLYHALHTKQHLPEDFICYHESDSYPHTRFFSSAAQLRTVLGTVYSYGFDGSTLQTQQLLDDPNEDPAYGEVFRQERARFAQVRAVARKCTLGGVELGYDPFWNQADKSLKGAAPQWLDLCAGFGIPYTSLPGGPVFLDARQARHANAAQVERWLSGPLFLDGDAAKVLCDRGYARDLGVLVGEDACRGLARFDLAEREVICPEFAQTPGRHMMGANGYSPAGRGNGLVRSLQVLDSRCQVLTQTLSFRQEVLNTAMTCYENARGGRVVTMGLTLSGNGSQALFNHRRQALLQQLLVACGDAVAFVRGAAQVFPVQNEAKAGEDFLGMLTLTNLTDDAREETVIHLPQKWQGAKQVRALDREGHWVPVPHSLDRGELTLRTALLPLTPCYLLIE